MSDIPKFPIFLPLPEAPPRPIPELVRDCIELALDAAVNDLDDLDATRAIAQTVRSWLASVDALDNLPKSDDILACQRWRNNAEMVAAILGLLDRTGQIPPGPWCDLTYGTHGGWWKPGFNPAPSHLVRCIGPDTTGYDGVPMWHDGEDGGLLGPGFYRIDFRRTPFKTGQFATTFIDPPYVLKGGKGAYDGMNQRYGVGLDTLADKKLTKRQQLAALIDGGFRETVRITKVGGIILAKAGRGVDGSKVFPSDQLMRDLAAKLGLELVWELIFPTVPRSQTHRGPQQSVRNNYSTLLVLRRVK